MSYEFFNTWIKFFFLLTPFFVMTVFLVLTKEMKSSQRHAVALKTTLAVVVITLILYFFGDILFDVFDITIDAFRIGAGSIVFLTSIELVSGKKVLLKFEKEGDISVVPMTIPITVGPGTIGALLVMGAGDDGTVNSLVGCLALVCAGISVGILLYISVYIERVIGKVGLEILSKITGLILSAISAQIVFTGIRNFLY